MCICLNTGVASSTGIDCLNPIKAFQVTISQIMRDELVIHMINVMSFIDLFDS